jgi:SSS family solute:Na+ symporter
MFARVNAPLLATILLGMFCKRITGHGAFAGLAAGIVVTALPSVFALPIGSFSSVRNGTALSYWTVLAAVAVTVLVATAVSLSTKKRPDAELAGMVHSLRVRGRTNATWWKRPEVIAAAILLGAIGITLIFA